MRRTRGVALIAVLWGLLLLSLIAAGIVGMTRSENRLVELHLAKARRDAAISSATVWATLMLLDNRSDRRMSVEGAPARFSYEGQTIEVSATLEAGRIDLNAAEDGLLMALFRSQGMSESHSADWLAKVRDWQDSDDARRLGGAEWPDYRQAGSAFGPRDAPMRSENELRRLLGMSGELFACLASAVTVYTGSRFPDARHSTPATLRALQWADKHQTDGHRWLLDAAQLTASSSASLAGQVIRLTLRFPDDPAHSATTTLIGRLTGSATPWLTMAVVNDTNNGDTTCEAVE